MTVAQISNYDPFDPPAAESADEMTRLVRALRLTDRFAIFVVTCNRADMRDQLIDEVKAANPDRRFEEIVVSRSVTSLLPALADLPVTNETPAAVFVYGLESFLADTDDVTHSAFVANLNRARDSFPEYLSCPLVLWIPDYVRNGVMRGAPDFYSVRSASFVFHAPFPVIDTIQEMANKALYNIARNMTPTERNQQIRDLQDVVSQTESLPDVEQNLPLLCELFGRLAGLYVTSGNTESAEALIRKALAIDPENTGEPNPRRATHLNNLGFILRSRGDLVGAERLVRESLMIHRLSAEPSHHGIATDLGNLAKLRHEQGDFSEAEHLLNEALEIRERALGEEHPDYLRTRCDLAEMFFFQGRLIESKHIFADILAKQELALGRWHPDIADTLNYLALSSTHADERADAESFLRRALEIHERVWGAEHPNVARTLVNLGVLLQRQGRIIQSKAILERALEINERTLGLDDLVTIRSRNALNGSNSLNVPLNSPKVFASTVAEKRVLTPLALPRVRGKRKSGKAK